MPRKIRELIADLEAAGFANRDGKGNHRNYVHPRVIKPITFGWKSRRRCATISETGRQKGHQGLQVMKDSARYVKIVEWSEEDGCYVGSCPGLLYGGCHGDDERKVFDEFCEIFIGKTANRCRRRPVIEIG